MKLVDLTLEQLNRAGEAYERLCATEGIVATAYDAEACRFPHSPRSTRDARTIRVSAMQKVLAMLDGEHA
jgi:hypothetical protein